MTDGMSDEPKKRSRGWIVWALIAFLLMVYPLSMPPALNWTIGHGHVRVVYNFYRPVMSVAKLPVLKDMMKWYSSIWGMGFDPD
jgi:hypothetical protein